MARSRNIKPAFFKNEYLAELSAHARLLFIGLWCMADVKGRMEYRPAKIRAELFPYETIDIESLLGELTSSPERFILIYEVDGCRYLEIPNFHKHQNPHPNEKKTGSRIPAPQEDFQESRLQVGYQSVTSNLPVGYSQVTSRADSLLLIPDSLTPETGVSESEDSGCVSGNGLENEKLATEGMLYLNSLNSPNHTNTGWVRGYLNIQLKELEQSRPDIPKPEILRIWRDVCDSAINNNASAVQWFKTAFKRKLDGWTPEQIKTPLPEPASPAQKTQAKALLEFPFVLNIAIDQTIPSEELEWREDSPNGLFHHGAYFPVGHLQGLTEVPAHV